VRRDLAKIHRKTFTALSEKHVSTHFLGPTKQSRRH
jgi:hypothetical protein